MNTATRRAPADAPPRPLPVLQTRGSSRSLSSSPRATAAFSVALIGALVAAWLHRESGYASPESGLGYALGVAGAAMIVALLLYPVRKRVRFMRDWIPMRHWFRAHMALGLVGPACILVHCNFQSGAINSKVALYSMLAVTVSGIIGRFIYARVHDGLYGSRSDLVALSLALAASRMQLERVPGLTPRVREQLLAMGEGVDSHPRDAWAGARQVMRVGGSTLWVGARLDACLAAAALADRTDAWKVFCAGRARVHDHLRSVRRVAGFAFFERLLSLWHMLHVPLFVVLLVTGFAHVVAVHWY